jgi:hypothetical protein
MGRFKVMTKDRQFSDTVGPSIFMLAGALSIKD